MSVKFTLTVTIEGNSLDEVDNGLVEAAGARIQARILKRGDAAEIHGKIKVDTSIATQRDIKEQMIATATAEQPALTKDEPAKVGRKHKPKDTTAAPRSEELPSPVETPTAKVVTKITREAAVEALSSVNAAKGIDAARALLTSFNVKRLSEISEDVLPEFVRQCENMV